MDLFNCRHTVQAYVYAVNHVPRTGCTFDISPGILSTFPIVRLWSENMPNRKVPSLVSPPSRTGRGPICHRYGISSTLSQQLYDTREKPHSPQPTLPHLLYMCQVIDMHMQLISLTVSISKFQKHTTQVSYAYEFFIFFLVDALGEFPLW